GAVITPGFRLKAKYVVHCVGPIYDREPGRAAELLEHTYREALMLVRKRELASITFPSISTGVYGYPVEKAAPVALEAVIDELKQHESPRLVRFSLFDENTYEVYRIAATDLLGSP
ncbi:MAG: macro domain-containing protein, partial [Polyangiales bacterium]